MTENCQTAVTCSVSYENFKLARKSSPSIILRNDVMISIMPMVHTLIVHSHKGPTVDSVYTTILFIEIHMARIFSRWFAIACREELHVRKFFGSAWDRTLDLWHSSLVRCLLRHARARQST